MRRLSLSTKLFAAALPLVVAVAGLLALTVRSDLNDIHRAESGADLGGVWEPLITALSSVEVEANEVADTTATTVASDETLIIVADPATRRSTDQAINDLRTSIEEIGAFEAASAHVTSARSALSAARRNIDMAAIAPQMAGDVTPSEAYALASRELVAVGQLLPAEAGDAQLGSELLAVVKLAEARLHANSVLAGTTNWPNPTSDDTPLVQARVSFANMLTTLGEFEAIAPDEWAAQYRASGFNTALVSFSANLDSVARAADAGRIETFDSSGFSSLIDQGVQFQSSISRSIVDRANAQAESTRSATLTRIGIILGIVLIASLTAWFITRSITRRVKAVADSANQVASKQLPALVEALRDPRGKAVLPEIDPVNAKGGDDLADLAQAFNSMQETLIDVAHEQVEVLRRGVSDIFITMARRNRSLIDRQLSMLDEFEASVDDPDILSNYYQLDHLATRMRRNSESLLVLANAEPKRRRVKATEIDDVVRASIGEVEDYRRVEIQHLESLQVRGNVVADISHLIAEILDNATSFSPPGSPVRVGGRRAGESYMLRIVDDGVGIPTERLQDLNDLLREPPVAGLSVESTLGMSVVSLLANKHDIEVTLSAGSPGLTVDVVLPSALFGPMDAPAEGPVSTPEPQAPAEGEPIVAWNDQPDGQVDETFQIAPPVAEVTPPVVAAPPVVTPDPTPAAAFETAALGTPTFDTPAFDTPAFEAAAEQPAPAPAPVAEPDPIVAGSDWTAMSLDVPSFDAPAPAAEQPVAEAPVTPESALSAPPDSRLQGEFDVPPAPPLTAEPLTQRPVSPDTARPAPIPAPEPEAPSGLPTRTQRGTGPDGPDRLANAAFSDAAPVATSEPSALQAALSAFDTGRSKVTAEPTGSLPSRDRVSDPASMIDEQQSVTQSRVDPSALRDRLRAFQSEFSGAGESAGGTDIYTDHNRDLGGDPR